MKNYVSVAVICLSILLSAGCNQEVDSQQISTEIKSVDTLAICSWSTPISILGDDVDSNVVIEISDDNIVFFDESFDPISIEGASVPEKIKDIILKLDYYKFHITSDSDIQPGMIMFGYITKTDKDQDTHLNLVFQNPLYMEFCLNKNSFFLPTSFICNNDKDIQELFGLSDTDSNMILYLDSDYIVKTWKIVDNRFVLDSYFEINPDKYHTSDDIFDPVHIIANYSFDIPIFTDKPGTNNGFIELFPSTNECIDKGNITNIPVPLEYKEDTLALPIRWFISQINAYKTTFDIVDGTYIVHTDYKYFTPKSIEPDFIPNPYDNIV